MSLLFYMFLFCAAHASFGLETLTVDVVEGDTVTLNCTSTFSNIPPYVGGVYKLNRHDMYHVPKGKMEVDKDYLLVYIKNVTESSVYLCAPFYNVNGFTAASIPDMSTIIFVRVQQKNRLQMKRVGDKRGVPLQALYKRLEHNYNRFDKSLRRVLKIINKM